jgi:hypothetical protein
LALPISVNVHLEEHVSSTSQPFHTASGLTDKPARLTERQAVFYRNLIRMSEQLQSQELPVDFVDATGAHMAMDLGCVKIAEHAGFIKSLSNGPDGTMKTICLSWLVVPTPSGKS